MIVDNVASEYEMPNGRAVQNEDGSWVLQRDVTDSIKSYLAKHPELNKPCEETSSLDWKHEYDLACEDVKRLTAENMDLKNTIRVLATFIK